MSNHLGSRIASAQTSSMQGQAGVFSAWPQSPRKRAALLGLKITGAASWTWAYHEAIQVARKTGKGVLPEIAISFNLAWEALYTAGGVWKWRDLDVEDKAQTFINAVWLGYDIRLLRALSHGNFRNKELLLAVLYQFLFLAKYPPGKAARISALWQNLAFSIYTASVNPAEYDDVSVAKFTALRAIGTAIPTLTSGLLRGIEPAYLLPGLGCIGFDLARIARDLLEKPTCNEEP